MRIDRPERSRLIRLLTPLGLLWAVACSDPSLTNDRIALIEELRANHAEMTAVADTLNLHIAYATHHLRWMEEVEQGGSGGMWEGMMSLRKRPHAHISTSAFEDLALRNRLELAIPGDELRRSLLDYQRRVTSLAESATLEYRALVEHYERALGSGEWRSVFELPPEPGGVFGVDYRTSLRLLRDDNHAATLRSLLRAQAEYLTQVTAALATSETLQTELLASWQ